MVSSLTSTFGVPSVTARLGTGPRRRVLPGRGGRRAKQGLLEADRAVGERITEPFPGNVISWRHEIDLHSLTHCASACSFSTAPWGPVSRPRTRARTISA